MKRRITQSGVFKNILPNAAEISKDLGQPGLIQESVPVRFARAVGFSASIAIFIGVAWSTVASVNEVSVAVGSLAPTGFEQTVQHLDGGIVQQLLVQEGDVVEAGQPLVLLKDASTFEDAETLESQAADLRAQIETQRALADDRIPDFGFIAPKFIEVTANNRYAYFATNDTLQSQRREIDSQISQAKLAIEAIQTQLSAAREEVDHAIVEEQRYSNLLQKGVATQVQYREKVRLLSRARSEVIAQTSKESATKERLKEVQQRNASFNAKFQAGVRQRILELQSSLTSIVGNIKKKGARKDRLVISAPIRGVVKSLSIRGIGEVVGSGEAVAVIVPLDGPLVAQTRVSASQIGYLELGQDAYVKLTAYDFTRFGWLAARIDGISPSAFNDENTGSYYVVKLALQETSLSRAPNAPILPGMELTADIITGQKTVLQYLLTPLQKSFSSAFGER